MRVVLVLFLILFLTSCNDTKNNNATVEENAITVSFEVGPNNANASVIVAYTNDPEEMWQDRKWVSVIKNKMVSLSKNYSTVLLFNAKDNMPFVATRGMNYSSDYDKHMVCGYWKYPRGKTQFCYGGVKPNGNFRRCE